MQQEKLPPSEERALWRCELEHSFSEEWKWMTLAVGHRLRQTEGMTTTLYGKPPND
tara:strand:- start:418 stop:585 length:168 start_codon:yes stop_codon:yes gene_type:complete